MITNEEQFAKISKYSDQMKDGAYYYFSIESDLDYSTGDIDPYISDFRGELDFNNHKLEGLSFTRLTELNRDDGKQRTALINYCYGGAIRNLEYRPVGQCNLVLYIKADNVNNDRTSFVFENTPLPKVLTELSHYYGVKLVADRTDKRLTANFDAHSLDEIIEIIEKVLKVHIKKQV